MRQWRSKTVKLIASCLPSWNPAVFALEIHEDEFDYTSGGARVARLAFLGAAVDADANRGRNNRAAVLSAPDRGANAAWRIIFGACQGAGAGHARSVFADSEPDLRFRWPD